VNFGSGSTTPATFELRTTYYGLRTTTKPTCFRYRYYCITKKSPWLCLRLSRSCSSPFLCRLILPYQETRGTPHLSERFRVSDFSTHMSLISINEAMASSGLQSAGVAGPGPASARPATTKPMKLKSSVTCSRAAATGLSVEAETDDVVEARLYLAAMTYYFSGFLSDGRLKTERKRGRRLEGSPKVAKTQSNRSAR